MRIVTKGEPPAVSYWVGASREELGTLVRSRRAQQAVPTDGELLRDPALAATEMLRRVQAEHKRQAGAA